MATSRYLAMISGALKMVVPATASTGTASAGQIVALNPSGKIDATMLSTSAVPNVPRDRTWSMVFANASNGGFDHIGIYSYPLSNNASQGSGTDSVGRQYISAVSNATIGSFVQVGYSNPSASLARSPSFHITAAVLNPSTTNTFICGFMANSGNGNFSPAYISASSYADPGKQNDNPMIAFLALANATYWQCYLSDGTHAGQTVSSGVAIDSAIHSFDILVNGTAVTFGIDGASVATITPTNALPTAYLYTSSMWFAPTTATAVTGLITQMYVGVN